MIGKFILPEKLSMKLKTLILIALCFPLLFSCDSGDDRSAADLAIPVVVEKVKRGPISEFVSATGTLQAQMEERLVTEVAGTLHLVQTNGSINFSGNRVSAGQLLAEIENQEWLLQVRVESQQLAMSNAERELQKQEALFREGGVTEKELEIARRNALDARLNYEAAQLRADKLKLKAPISGIVSNLQSIADGTLVPAGFQFCTISNYSKVLLDTNLPNSDVGRIQIGQDVNITNYALEGQIFNGKVISIDPTVNPQTRTFKVTIEAMNTDFVLRPGMFVKADIVVKHQPEAIVIPANTIQTRDNRPVVFVISGTSAEMVEVSTGITTREEVEIVNGLEGEERLVIKGYETLRDKSKVRVTK